MQGSQIRTLCIHTKTGVWIVCVFAPLWINLLSDGTPCCRGAQAADEVKPLSNLEHLQLTGRPAYPPVQRALDSSAAPGDITGTRGGRNFFHSLVGKIDVTKESGMYWFNRSHTLPLGTHTAARLLRRSNPTRISDTCGGLSKKIFQEKKCDCSRCVHSEENRALLRRRQSKRASEKVVSNYNCESPIFKNVELREERELHRKKERGHQRAHQPSKHTQAQQEQQRRHWAAMGIACFPEKTLPSDNSSLDERETECLEEVVPSTVNDNSPGNRGSRLLSPVRKDSDYMEVAGSLAESLMKKRTAEAISENEWKLIEESWKRVELFYKDFTAFSANGLRYHRQKDGRSVIQAVLPFWEVDLLGALEDMAKAAAWRVFGVPATSATRPMQLKTGNGGKDAVVHIGYSPSWQRDTYTFGWNDTQITYSTGVDPTEAWSLERFGGNRLGVPVGHLMEVTTRDGGGKAFHDLSSRLYGHEVNVGNVHMGITHQFYNETYDATPSNIVVKGQDYSVDIGADPTDTSYRVGVGNDETLITVRREFDDRKTAFQGNFMDWAVSLTTDAQDASSSSLSAEAFVGNKSQEPFLTANVYRGAEEHYAQGDTQIQMNDLGMRLHWREEGLTGNVTLGKIKYKFDMKEGLPNFTLTAS